MQPWGIPEGASEYQLRSLIYEHQMALFRIQEAIGMDTDGDSDPGAYIRNTPDGALNYVTTVVEDVRHFRKDYEAALDEMTELERTYKWEAR